jgi:hypothetical protein
MNEKEKRLFCASESLNYGRGGITYISKLYNISRSTIYKGLVGLKKTNEDSTVNIRNKGGGRKTLNSYKYNNLLSEIKSIIIDKNNTFSLINKSLRIIKNELSEKSIDVSITSISKYLKKLDFIKYNSLFNYEVYLTSKDIFNQINYINNKCLEFIKDKNPIMFVECKQNINIENKDFDYELLSKELSPLSHYELTQRLEKIGYMNIEVSTQTTPFFIDSIVNYIENELITQKNKITKILIISNTIPIKDYYIRLRQIRLSEISNSYNLEITLLHLPNVSFFINEPKSKVLSFKEEINSSKSLFSQCCLISTLKSMENVDDTTTKIEINSKKYNSFYEARISSLDLVDIDNHIINPTLNYTIKPKKK